MLLFKNNNTFYLDTFEFGFLIFFTLSKFFGSRQEKVRGLYLSWNSSQISTWPHKCHFGLSQWVWRVPRIFVFLWSRLWRDGLNSFLYKYFLCAFIFCTSWSKHRHSKLTVNDITGPGCRKHYIFEWANSK